jgi:hypothetical protein
MIRHQACPSNARELEDPFDEDGCGTAARPRQAMALQMWITIFALTFATARLGGTAAAAHTFCAAETRLPGWACRTRTCESVRALSDWNSVTTSFE